MHKLIIIVKAFFALPKELLKPIIRHFRSVNRYPHVSVDYPVNILNCKIDSNVKVFSGAYLNNVTIGSKSYIGGGAYIRNCVIGKFCSLAPNVQIGLGIHPSRHFVSTYPGFYAKAAGGCVSYFKCDFEEYKSVIIGNDVWIGQGVIILDGVDIGDGAIVGAGSVVTKNVAPYEIVAGVPAKHIRYRFSKQQSERLELLKWWNWPDCKIRDLAPTMNNINTFIEKCNMF